MLSKIITASLLGMDAEVITVETDLQPGLPAVHMVGLADTTIKEARERIRAAILNSGFGTGGALRSIFRRRGGQKRAAILICL